MPFSSATLRAARVNIATIYMLARMLQVYYFRAAGNGSPARARRHMPRLYRQRRAHFTMPEARHF